MTNDGERHTAVAAVDPKGRFARNESSFRDRISNIVSEKNRYKLIVSYACPWATRCLSVLYLKGLEDGIEVDIVHPTWQKTRRKKGKDDEEDTDEDDGHAGWVFPNENCRWIQHLSGIESAKFEVQAYHTRKDPKKTKKTEFYSIRDFYEEHDNSYKGPFTVPILYDQTEKRIVNNESSEIIRDLNARFQPLAKNATLDLLSLIHI